MLQGSVTVTIAVAITATVTVISVTGCYNSNPITSYCYLSPVSLGFSLSRALRMFCQRNCQHSAVLSCH